MSFFNCITLEIIIIFFKKLTLKYERKHISTSVDIRIQNVMIFHNVYQFYYIPIFI